MRIERVALLLMMSTGCMVGDGDGFTSDPGEPVSSTGVVVASIAATGPGTYTFTLAQAGSYTLTGNVIAPDDSSNSFFIDIDSDPANSTARIWDVLPFASTYAPRVISWRGNGTYDTDQFNPKTFNLAAGTHTLYIRAREAGTLINGVTVNGTASPPVTTGCPTGSSTYYVSTTGSDSSSGSASSPLRTITKAYSKASPGTVIIVMPGTYTDYQSGWGLHLGSSGTATAPIYLCSQTRGAAIIDGQNLSDRNEAIYIDGSYNVVDGFVITRGPKGGISIWGDGNRLLRNEIHHNGNNTTYTTVPTDGQDGVYSDSTTAGGVYQQNYIHDNGRTTDPTYYKFDHGLYLCGDNEVVIDNIAVHNASMGLQIAGYTTVTNMKVYNNVLSFNGGSGIVLWQALNGVDIKNNIIVGNKKNGIYNCSASGPGVVIDHNVVSGNNVSNGGYANLALGDQCGSVAFSYTLSTTLASDPMFVNSTAAFSQQSDFQLRTGSPAIDSGLALSAVTVDITGAPRPQGAGYDIGAYER
jgi:hypothetical protein